MGNVIDVLNDKANLFEVINDASTNGIIVCDNSLIVSYWNKASEALTGFSRTNAIGRPFFELFPQLQSNPIVTNGIGYTLKGMKVFISYENARDPDVFNEYHFIPLKDELGTTMGILVIIHDIAHRIKAERELKKLNESLIKRNKQLNIKNAELAYFSKAAGYDFSEPLSRINSLAELLINKRTGDFDIDISGLLKRIQNNAQKVSLLSESLQVYYDICSRAPVLTKLDPYAMLLKATHIAAEPIDFRDLVIIPKQLPAIQGDRNLLSLLFQHIISNAVKFCKTDHSPRIVVTAETVGAPENSNAEGLSEYYMRISFADNGIGFNMKDADTIFMLFQRLHQNKFPGAGIGLAISKKVAEQHGGFMTAESDEKKGSTFHLWLPLCNQELIEA